MNPFSNHIPSVFVVWSPFQILCAISAMRQLEINDYLLVLYYPKDGARNKQNKALLERYNIKYKVVSERRPYLCSLLALLGNSSKYKRLFVGDYRNYFQLLVGCSYVANRADVIYLDDGNPTVQLLTNQYTQVWPKRFNIIVRMVSRFRKLEFMKNFLTIYDSISNSSYNIKTLNLSNVIETSSSEIMNNNTIVIIGTNAMAYCGALGIEENVFIRTFDEFCGSIASAHQEDTISYYPHGRETKLYDQSICNKHSIKFCKTSTLIELELLSQSIYPKEVYGFSSNALLTIKKLLPNTRVVNVLFDSGSETPGSREYQEIAEYYTNNEIECLKVPVAKNNN